MKATDLGPKTVFHNGRLTIAKPHLTAHQAWRHHQPDGVRLDLRDADLSEADLRRVHLGGAVLRGAVLPRSDLRGASLGGADLSGATLRSAYLRHVDLRGADLTDTDLTDADLRDADLRGAVGVLAFWQGGAIGPRRRSQTIVVRPDGAALVVSIQQGCFVTATVDELVEQLRIERLEEWSVELGSNEAAEAEIEHARRCAELGVEMALAQANRELTRLAAASKLC